MTLPVWLTRSKVTTALTALAGALISLQGALQLAPPDSQITIPPIVFLVLGLLITACVAINDALVKLVSGTWAAWLGLAASVLGAIAPQLSLISTRHGFYAMVAGLVIAGLGGPLMKSSGEQVIEAQKTMPPQQVLAMINTFPTDEAPKSGAEIVEHVTAELPVAKSDPRPIPRTGGQV